MPSIRKLTIDEAHVLENKGKTKRQLIEEQYDQLLAEISEGEYAEATPEEGERKALVRKRLKEAAQRRGVTLRFLRTTDDGLRFQVGITRQLESLRLLPYATRSVDALEDVEDIPF